MNSVKKMALVPYSMLTQFKDQQQMSPELVQLKNLDQELLSILSNPTLLPDEKLKLYDQVYQRYIASRHQVQNQTFSVPIVPQAERIPTVDASMQAKPSNRALPALEPHIQTEIEKGTEETKKAPKRLKKSPKRFSPSSWETYKTPTEQRKHKHASKKL